MTILWSIHLYPPKHNCGAEFMAHSINKFLISRGHHVRVLLRQANKHKIIRPYEYEGVQVFPPTVSHEGLAATADVILTHLDYTWESITLGRKAKKPVVHFVHNDTPYQSVLNDPGVSVVYNSEWIRERLSYPNNSMVMRPPCDHRYYNVCEKPIKNEFITLINLDWNKGGHILKEIALRMPDKKFLAVTGSYSYDDKGQFLNQPMNVKVIPNTPDILSVYRQTRVLIMPSLYESWGRTATEAMCNGIPVIYNPTPGLKENVADAGVRVDREDIDGWVSAIKRLDNEKTYITYSKKARARSLELDPLKEMEEFENWLKMVTGRNNRN